MSDKHRRAKTIKPAPRHRDLEVRMDQRGTFPVWDVSQQGCTVLASFIQLFMELH